MRNSMHSHTLSRAVVHFTDLRHRCAAPPSQLDNSTRRELFAAARWLNIGSTVCASSTFGSTLKQCANACARVRCPRSCRFAVPSFCKTTRRKPGFATCAFAIPWPRRLEEQLSTVHTSELEPRRRTGAALERAGTRSKNMNDQLSLLPG